MTTLIYLFFILLSFGQLGRIPILGTGAVYLHELVMVLLVITVILRESRLTGRLNLPAGRQGNLVKPLTRFLTSFEMTPIILFTLTLTFSLAISLPFHTSAQNLIAIAYLLRLVLYFLFFLSLRCLKREIAEKGLIVFTALTITFSYLQYFLVPSLQFLVSDGWDPHVFRVFGTFFDVTPAGIIFVLLFFWLFRSKTISHLGYLRLLGLVSLFGLILLTYSRITYIGFLAGLLFLLYKRIASKEVLLIAFLFTCSLFILPRPASVGVQLERTFSVQSRIVDIKQGIEIFKTNPLFGIGYNQIGSIKKITGKLPNHAASGFSSSYIIILATSGIIGFILFGNLLLKMYQGSSVWGKLFTIIVAVASLFENVLLMNFILGIYLVLIFLEDNR